jgi:hypothetical protein
MGNPLIIPTEIAGGAVYGVAQYEYTVDGAGGKDYSAALAAASLKESVAIEDAAAAYSVVVRQRERKIEDLGIVLAALAESIATMDPKSQDTGKQSDWSERLSDAKEICKKYDLTLTLSAVRYQDDTWSAKITYRDATKAQNDIQYAMDTEDNNLKQDMVSLQSFISKRDNAFSAASKIVRKSDGTAGGIIRNIT